MQPFQITTPASASGLSASQNRVLRNTYAMLGLTMVPTVIGALIGVSTNFSLPGGPLLSFVLFMAIAFGFFWGINKTKNSPMGVALLLGFTFFMGLLLSGILRVALGFGNGGTLIALAAGGTGAIFFTLSTIAATTKRNFTNMGKFLFIGIVVLLLAMLANIFLQLPALSLTISAVAVMLFSAWILYDISRIVHGGETNYIMATLSVYLNLFNLFVHLLQLLMVFAGERD